MEQYSFLESLLQFEEHFSFPIHYPQQKRFLNYTQRENFHVTQPSAAKADKRSFNALIPLKHKPNLNMYLIWHQQVSSPRYVNSDLLEASVSVFIFTGLYMQFLNFIAWGITKQKRNFKYQNTGRILHIPKRQLLLSVRF